MKYILLNDLEYLIHKKYKLLFVLFLFSILYIFINILNEMTGIELINQSLGTHINQETANLFSYIEFAFNIVVFLFIVIDIYVKDVEYQLDNFFLRLSPIKWYLKKTIIFILTILLIKFIQYFLIYITVNIASSGVEIHNFIKLLFSDYIYIISMQFIFLLIYMLVLLIFNNRLTSILIYIILLLMLPKDIYGLGNNLIYLMLTIIIINAILLYIFKKYNKNIIENL